MSETVVLDEAGGSLVGCPGDANAWAERLIELFNAMRTGEETDLRLLSLHVQYSFVKTNFQRKLTVAQAYKGEADFA